VGIHTCRWVFVSLLALVAYTSDSPARGKKAKKRFNWKKHVQRARVAHNDWNWQQKLDLLDFGPIGQKLRSPFALQCTGSLTLESSYVIVFGPISACFACPLCWRFCFGPPIRSGATFPLSKAVSWFSIGVLECRSVGLMDSTAQPAC